ncbi:LURP-one-related/scramblase family protein [Streptococcus plurextorum]|uniref:LURP-one-related/scramblase family protein n=1 Tax=Streptococcus plurextorum TaxID=456876 RepID=UPI0004188E37|nr:LURP-one-related family protein [Streptococcus plurextorum]
MKQFQVKQRFTFGGEKFEIRDSEGELAYQVEGSFLEIPKRFIVMTAQGREVCQITKKFLTFLPQFTIDMANGHSFYLQKAFTFFKDRYRVENLGLLLEGNIWDLDFSLKTADGQLVAQISKEVFHLTSHYAVRVLEDEFADLVISLVVAIDYVEMLENASN